MALNGLGEFEGLAIAGTTLAIRNAGDGLSQAMKVDPKVLHQHDTVYVVLECTVADVSFPPIKDSNEVNRKHVLRAGNATLIDGSVVKKALNDQAARIQEARDAQTGAQALDLAYDEGADPEAGQPAPKARKPRARKATAKVKAPAKKRLSAVK